MIFRLDFKRGLAPMIVWILFITLIAAAGLFMFSISTNALQADSFGPTVKSLPPMVRGALCLNGISDLSNIYHFTAYMFFLIMLLTSLYAGAIGAKLLAGEESRGTIEFLYSLPVKRGSILRQKVVSGALRFLIFTAVIYLITSAIIPFLNDETSFFGALKWLSKVFLPLLLCGYVFMAIGVLFSSLFRSTAESLSVTIALTLITYILGMTGKILSGFDMLRYASPIHANMPYETFVNGWDIFGIIIGAAVIVICLALAGIRYKKKDFII